MTLFASVKFVAEGFHRWPNPTENRLYLQSRHRHLFHVKVDLEVRHDEREVEFHDLLGKARTLFGTGDFGDRSCETLARQLAEGILARWPGRQVQVEVFEDGEVGAILQS